MKPSCNPFFASSRSQICTACALATLLGVSPTFAVIWDGNGDSNASGNWSVGANWNPDTVTGGPTTGGGLGDLGNVTTGTRTVTYDAAALNGAVSSLSFTQTTAGAVNQLLINGKSLAVSNAFTLGATGGTALLTVGSTSTTSFNLTPTGGMTINSGGELALTGTGIGTGNVVGLGNITGTGLVTVAGGILRVSPSVGVTTNSVQNSIAGGLTMTSGSIIIDNSTGQADRRLDISGNVSITGGTISTTFSGANGTLSLNGATNVVSPTTFDTDLSITLSGSISQSLTTSATLGGVALRGTGASLVKTVTSSASGNAIGQVQFINSANNGTTTLKLGSNLTSASLPAAQNFGNQGGSSSGTVNFGIDTDAGFVLDLSSNTGTYTPNTATNGSAITTNYTFSGTGRIKVANIDTNSATQVNIGAGTTIEVTGSASNANDDFVLSGGGTISPTSTFLYSGTAATGTPATLTSTRNIGNLNLNTAGALRIASNLTAGGLVTVGSGATLNLSTNTLSATGLTVNNGSINTPGNLTIIGTGANVLKTGANTLVLSNTANSYTGTTTLQDGVLQYSGSVPVSGNSTLGNAASAIILGTSSSTVSQRIQFFNTTGGTVARDIIATGGTSVATDAPNANR